MAEITEKSLKRAYKPYDIVTDDVGNVGFIKETSLNEAQTEFNHQVTYSVEWLVVKTGHPKNAWWQHEDLRCHTNMFKEIAKVSCHDMGYSSHSVDKLFKHF